MLLSFYSSAMSKNLKTICDAKQGIEIDDFFLESIFNLGCNRRVVFRLTRVPGKKQQTLVFWISMKTNF